MGRSLGSRASPRAGGFPTPGEPSALASGAMLDPKVFKAYDVRGVHPTEIDEDGAYRVGRAFVEHFGLGTIAVGRDMRLSAPVDDGRRDRGRGGRRRRRARPRDGRHRDALLRRRRARPRRRHRRHRVAQPEAVHGDEDRPRAARCPSAATPASTTSGARRRPGSATVARRGEVRPTDIWDGFVAKVLSFVDPTSIRPLRIVVDAANGMAGTMLPPVLERLPQLDVVRCFFEPDGSFPNHEPNPLLPENREFIVERTRAEGADLGVAYDGDADRCFFVDDTGEFVPGDFVTALLARAMLEKEPGATDHLRRPRELGGAARDRGGRRRRRSSTASATRSSRSGCARSTRCSPARSPRTTTSATSRGPTPGVVPFLVMLELLSRGGRRLSELLAPFRERYFLSGEINTPVADVDAQAPGDRGALRGRGRAHLASRRRLGRLRRLALQRPPLEHRAAPAPQPRGPRRAPRWSAGATRCST